MNDLGLTVFDLKNLKGKRTVKFVQVDTLDQAIAAKEAGIEMIGTGYSESKSHYPRTLKGVHFQFGLQWGEHANADVMVLFSELGGVLSGFLQGVGYHCRPGIMIFICGRLPFTKDPVFIGNGDLAGLVVYGQQGIGIRERF